MVETGGCTKPELSTRRSWVSRAKHSDEIPWSRACARAQQVTHKGESNVCLQAPGAKVDRVEPMVGPKSCACIRPTMLTTVIVMCIAISEAFVHQLSGFKLQPMVHPRHRGAAKLCRQAWRQQAGYASKATAVSIQAHVAGRPEDETKRSKLFRARKLLDESRMAFESWRSARPKTDLKISTASGLNETESPDLVSEFRIRSQWSRTGRALYGTWLKVFGGEAGTTFLSDPLGLQYASEGEDWIRAAFERIDLDRSGTIDNAELSAIIKEMTGLPANETTVRKLLSEATLQSQPQAGSESAVVMSQSDFAGPMRALLDQRRALGLASEIGHLAS